MIGYKIKIARAKLETYWYAKHIGDEFWCTKPNDMFSDDYSIINTGVVSKEDAFRWIDGDDCEVIKQVPIDVVSTVNVVELE